MSTMMTRTLAPPTDVPMDGQAFMRSPSGALYEFLLVTPAMAERWLTRNTNNRKARKPLIDRLARDIAGGEYLENGSAVCFDTNGVLIDGQHRLMAIVQSGVPVHTLVVSNLDPRAILTIDDGAKRTMADRFTWQGHQNANTAAAVVRRVIMWQAGYKHNAGQYQPTVAETLSAVVNDPTIDTAIEAAVKFRTGRLLPPTIIGLTWWLFWGLDEDDCVEFWEGLHNGAGLSDSNPIHIVRNQIIRRNADAGRIPESVYLAWVIKAWNFWRSGRSLSPTYKFRLRPDEDFPEPK